METKIYEIINQYNNLLVVVTGDITTAAEPPAYEQVNNYLRDYPFISYKLRTGLELERNNGDNLFVVPGNHDMWLYGGWFTKWKRYSNRREIYMKYFPQNLPHAYPLFINGISVTIYAIDTNCVKGFNPLNFKNVLGKGEVSKEQITAIYALHNNLLRNEYKVPKDFDYRSSLKIAIMHHHLALPKENPDNIEQKLLKLSDAQNVLNLLSQVGVHMVLCGHQHFPYQIPDLKASDESERSIFLSCAGSASQMDSGINSFSVYEIKRNDAKTLQLRVLVYSCSSKNEDYDFKKSEPWPDIRIRVQ